MTSRTERNYYWAIGRLAEVEGEDALFSDLRARLYMTVDEAKAHYDSARNGQACGAPQMGSTSISIPIPSKPKTLDRFEPWFPMFFFEGSIGVTLKVFQLEELEHSMVKISKPWQ